MAKLRSYHFDFGDSRGGLHGQVGFCARVLARSKKDAVRILRQALPEQVKIHPTGTGSDNARIEYIEAYFHTESITPAHVDFVEG